MLVVGRCRDIAKYIRKMSKPYTEGCCCTFQSSRWYIFDIVVPILLLQLVAITLPQVTKVHEQNFRRYESGA